MFLIKVVVGVKTFLSSWDYGTNYINILKNETNASYWTQLQTIYLTDYSGKYIQHFKWNANFKEKQNTSRE